MANNSLIAAFGRMWQQIKTLIDDNNETIDSKISNVNSALDIDVTNLNNHKNNYTMHITSEERSKWNTIENIINTTEIDYLFRDNKSEFYIENDSYYFIEGMTWEDWINSPFNTNGYTVNNDFIHNSQGFRLEDADGALVRYNDFIIAYGYYTAKDNFQ